jgi:Trp operon repressor
MAQVSRRPLPPRVWTALWQQLVHLVSQKYPDKESGILLDGLITPTERIVLAKRLMVGIFTVHGYNTNEIAQTLNVSTSTAHTHQQLVLNNVAYQELLKKIYPRTIKLGELDNVTKFYEELLNLFNQPKLVHKKRIRLS